ncbi:glycosyl hydrolase family 28-related protein [Streptomyces sp. NBC_00237]|uniref:glycosyl hydrolase family 28-related protein n=1 Tax=Streptomyces sp. NBC_00237 TaxID=2975687 RepID=UPI002B1DF8C6|nr:glycosyl hydrolase family 28-related protein [Streptomyces sp. NBC_00237]
MYVDFGGGRIALVPDISTLLRDHQAAHDPHGTTDAIMGEIQARAGSPGGLATLDEMGLVPVSQLPEGAGSGGGGSRPSAVDWLSVRAYGARGDGYTDDTRSIQRAIDDAGIGGTVYLPKGIYGITAPLDLPPGVILMGSHSNLMVGPGMLDEDFECYIQALPSFKGIAMITIIGQDDGVHPPINGEQRLLNFMLDGSRLTAGAVDGIYSRGNVQNVVMRDLCIRKVPNNGVITASNPAGEWPYSWRLHSVMIDNCRANGIVFERQTDLSLIDCQVIGVSAVGIKLSNCANTILMGCRVEWTGSHGYHFTGDWGNWPGSGSMVMTSCSTDRCGHDGVRIDASGNAAFLINSLMTRRDGRNGGPGGGNYSGLALLGRAPVVVQGVTCYTGTDDQGTANTSPQYGVRISKARDVSLDGAYLHALTKGLYDDGTSERVTLGTNITTVAGTNYSEARIPLQTYAKTSQTDYAAKGIYVPPSWGEFWKPKRDAAATGGKARIVVVGGSASQGYFASDLHSKGWVGEARTALQAKYGNGGSGVFTASRSMSWVGKPDAVPAITEWLANSSAATQTGTWATGASTYGPGIGYVITDTTGSSMTFKVTGSTVKIYTLTGPNAKAGYKYTIDAAAPVTVANAGGAVAAVQVTTVTGLVPTDHTVTLTWDGTSSGTKQYLSIMGVSGENTSGIVVDNLAKAGAQAKDYGDATDAGLNAVWNGGKMFPADLVIFTAGPNDAAAGTTGDAWANSVARYIQAVKNANNGATDVMLMLPHLGKHDTVNYLYQDYAVRARGLAESYGAAFVNMWAIGRNSWDYWNSLGYWGTPAAAGQTGTNSVHPSDLGYAHMASRITPILMS